MARILFVDDDPSTLETLMKAVQVFGHQALLAGTGEEALVIAAEQVPDLIFTDLMLPDMDGMTLIRKLRQIEVTMHIPLLVLSASPVLDAVERAEAAGANIYLNKPVRLQALLDIIREFTDDSDTDE